MTALWELRQGGSSKATRPLAPHASSDTFYCPGCQQCADRTAVARFTGARPEASEACPTWAPFMSPQS
ncbi:hypothetical protein OPT61_g8545 [Boeremia exigua]|uniref:Uncharacterized protein n=1 Tax=Boeremia exigua TaxID=749465 RepID=A0ACC2HZ01_9PLEO|nr:hypothetical protein OPT61_g8545 [Boeremia exigua]